MANRPIRAAIVGGGIGGLAAANALVRRGVEVNVYEQAPALGEVGAGVFVSPNSIRQLHRMGLEDRLRQVGGKVGANSKYYRMDGQLVGPVLTADSAGTVPAYGMHRADLLNALAEVLPAGIVHTGHRCTGYEETAQGATIRFANGASADADVVIAADGIQSVLRAEVAAMSKPVHSGSLAYRGLLPRKLIADWPEEAFLVWMGDKKHFMTYPVRDDAMISYIAFVPATEQTIESWSAIGDRNQLAAAFVGWDPRVVKLISRIESCYWWGLYDREPLPTWRNGRLALLGDAAHPMLPHLGQGANQSIEDAVALAILLEGIGQDEIGEALRRYEMLRKPRTDRVQDEARKNGRRYDSQYKDLEQRDAEIRASLNFRRWLYDYDVARDATALAHDAA